MRQARKHSHAFTALPQSSSWPSNSNKDKYSSSLMIKDCLKAFSLGALVGLVILIFLPGTIFDTKARSQHYVDHQELSIKNFIVESPQSSLKRDYRTESLLAAAKEGRIQHKKPKKLEPHFEMEERIEGKHEKEKEDEIVESIHEFISEHPTLSPSTPPPTPFQCLAAPPGAKRLINTREETIESVKFYIPPEIEEESNKLVSCLKAVLDLDEEKTFSHQDIIDLTGTSSTFEYILNDILLLNGLKKHQNRVYNLDNASLVLLDLPFQLSFALPTEIELDCNQETHKERMNRYHELLYGLGLLELNKPLSLVLSYPIGTKISEKILTKELYSTLLLERYYPYRTISLTTNNHVYYKSRQNIGNSVEIPSLLNPYLISNEKRKTYHERDIMIYLDEVFHTDYKNIKNIFNDIKSFLIESEKEIKISIRSSEKLLVDHRKIKALNMKKSIFCIILPGIDSRLSKSRLVDAVYSGCIPIVFQAQDAPKITPVSFPFPSDIPWKDIGYYFDNLDCIESNIIETANEINSLFQKIESVEGQLELENKQVIGQKYINNLLIGLNDENKLIDSLLLELGARL